MNLVNKSQRTAADTSRRWFVLFMAGMLIALAWMVLPQAHANTNDAEWQRLLKAEEERHQERWDFLRDAYFDDKPIGSAEGILEIKAPVVPTDAAVVPVSIRALLPQTNDRYIRRITLLVDHNPAPLAAVFHLSQRNGVADLATRVRVGEFSFVRAIAEFNDGELVAASTFIKASGGCDVVPFEDTAATEKRLGKMKLRLPGGALGSVSSSGGGVEVKARLADLLIEHPNYNGMQASNEPGVMIPIRTLDRVEVMYAGKALMQIEGHQSLSHNPKFRFHYVPDEESGTDASGGFTVRALDSSDTEFVKQWPAQ
ncbi:MAG: quinoprotein dehydrogenase-associated SoxYZ-like carrier [Burkholderiaceae bacterium]